MLHFSPDRFVPGRYTGNRRLYFKECASLFLLYFFAFVYAYTAKDLDSGIMPGWWNELLTYIRHFPCPFCGATRSVLYMCRGNLIEAAHFNLFGILFFAAGLFDMTVKLIYLYICPAPWIEKKLFFVGRLTFFLSLVFSLWGIQLLLHYTGIFSWRLLEMY